MKIFTHLAKIFQKNFQHPHGGRIVEMTLTLYLKNITTKLKLEFQGEAF